MNKLSQSSLLDLANTTLALINKEHLPYLPDTRVRRYATAARNDLQTQVVNTRLNVSILRDELFAAEHEINQLNQIVDLHLEMLDEQADRMSNLSESVRNLGLQVTQYKEQNMAISAYARDQIGALQSVVYALAFGMVISIAIAILL